MGEKMTEGILPLWKEKGMTSFTCVKEVRKILGIQKVGHAGTLDPDVDGVLPLAIGPGTKVLEFMLEDDKTYTGEITLGFSTSTEDAGGEVIEREAVTERIADTKIDNVLAGFVGTIEQTPPMYSAVKVEGKRLYEYAFEGKEIERPSRQTHIYSLERTSEINLNNEEKTLTFSFEVACSKGTYVRTLAVDIGKKLGYPAHMSQLTRTQSGSILPEQTHTLAEVKQAQEEGAVESLLLPIEAGLTEFPTVTISEALWEKVKNGALLKEDEIPGEDYPILLMHKETAVALYSPHPRKEGILKPRKMFKIEL